MSTLTDLPGALLGKIYSYIEDVRVQKSLFHSCKILHNCDAILSQFCHARVGFGSAQGSLSDELVCSWPAQATLRALTMNAVEDQTRASDFFAAALSAGPESAIGRLLSTVTEVRLVGPGLGDCRHFVQPNAEQAHALGASLAACPRLQKLELLGYFEGSLIKALSEGTLRQQIQEVRAFDGKIMLLEREDTNVLLNEGVKCVRYMAELPNLKVVRLHLRDYHVRALRHLKNLHTLELGYRDWGEEVSGLEDVLGSCTALQELRVYKLPQRVRLQCKPLKKLVIFNLNLSDLPKVLANQKGLPSLEHVRIVYGITIPESMDSYGKFECVAAILKKHAQHINTKLSGSLGGGELCELGPVGNYYRYYDCGGQCRPRMDTSFGFYGRVEESGDLMDVALEPVQPFFARSIGPEVRLAVHDIFPGSVQGIVALMPHTTALTLSPVSPLVYNTLVQLVERLPELRTLVLFPEYNADLKSCMMACEAAHKAGRPLRVVLMAARPLGLTGVKAAGDMDDVGPYSKSCHLRDTQEGQVWQLTVAMMLEWRKRARSLPECQVRVGYEFLTWDHHDSFYVPATDFELE